MYGNLYTEKTKELIKRVGFIDLIDNPNMPPHVLFREIALNMFRNNTNGTDVISIRNILAKVENTFEPVDFSKLDDLII